MMPIATAGDTVDLGRDWYIIGRWQEYEGEARANLLRLIGVIAFYGVELVNYYGLQLGPLEMPAVVDRAFHVAATSLAVAWTMVCLVILLCLKQHVFPGSLKFLSTGCDIVLLTSMLMIADGPKSPLVVGYFLIVALSSVRFSLRLVQAASVGSMAGYLFLSGFARWFTERDLRVPRYHQLMVLLALGLTGIVLGQVIRRVPGLAAEYAKRTAAAKGDDSSSS